MSEMANTLQLAGKKKRERKANFSDEEVRVLLEGIGQEKDVIQSKLMSCVTARLKNEVWAKVTKAVNACSKEALRSEEDVKKKWKDLKSAVLREQSDQKKTGGGGPAKETPFKEMIFYIIGDKSECVSGIEVAGTDSFELCLSGLATLAPMNTSQFSQLDLVPQHLNMSSQHFDNKDNVDSFLMTSLRTFMETSTATTSGQLKRQHQLAAAATSATTSGDVADVDVDYQPPPAKVASSAPSSSSVRGKNIATGKKFRKQTTRPSKSGSADGDELFNAWLLSEIETNVAKRELIQGKKELIELKRRKAKFEIMKLESELVVFDPEF